MKANRAPILSAIILLALGLAAAGCPKSWSELTGKTTDLAGPAGEGLPSPLQKYQDPDFGFSLVLPSDWEIIKRDQNPVLFARPQDAGPSGPMVNVVIEHTDMTLGGPRYFWFFVACMLLAACVFSVIAYFYRGREYIQD